MILVHGRNDWLPQQVSDAFEGRPLDGDGDAGGARGPRRWSAYPWAQPGYPYRESLDTPVEDFKLIVDLNLTTQVLGRVWVGWSSGATAASSA